MSLTELEIKKLKPKERKYSVCDDRGLYLIVFASGTKSWSVRHQIGKKTVKKTIGNYPIMSLKEARRIRDEMTLQQWADDAGGITFRDLADEWFRRKMKGILSDGHTDKVTLRLDNYILPHLGDKYARTISSAEVLKLLNIHVDEGRVETAHRLLGIIGQIFRYGIVTQRLENDPTTALRGALPSRSNVHFASITKPDEIGALLRSIHCYVGGVIIKYALLMSAYTFPRPNELRNATWEEFDLGERMWRIPAERMKAKRPHLVPLSDQVVVLLERLREFSGHSEYLFPSMRSPGKPISDGTLNMALRSMGYDNKVMVTHGFRSMASTRLNESGLWSGDAIERQLAHVQGNTVRSAYNYAEYLQDRRRMMQWWADYLDGLREKKPLVRDAH